MLLFILLLCCCGSLWAAFSVASFSLWLVFTVLGICFSIALFVLKHTFKLIAVVGVGIIVLSLLGFAL